MKEGRTLRCPWVSTCVLCTQQVPCIWLHLSFMHIYILLHFVLHRCLIWRDKEWTNGWPNRPAESQLLGTKPSHRGHISHPSSGPINNLGRSSCVTRCHGQCASCQISRENRAPRDSKSRYSARLIARKCIAPTASDVIPSVHLPAGRCRLSPRGPPRHRRPYRPSPQKVGRFDM